MVLEKHYFFRASALNDREYELMINYFNSGENTRLQDNPNAVECTNVSNSIKNHDKKIFKTQKMKKPIAISCYENIEQKIHEELNRFKQLIK